MSFATRYLHCQKLLVKRGEKVERGQVIALVGSTGASTGPHLHFDAAADKATIERIKPLEVGRALPGCNGRLAIPVEQLCTWIYAHAKGDWKRMIVEPASLESLLLPICVDSIKRLGNGWYASRPVYLPDGTHKRGPDGKELRQLHQGIDLSAKLGTEILAARSGTVALARTGSPSAGNWIVLVHES